MNAHQEQSLNRLSAADGYRLWAQDYDRDPNPLLALEKRVLADKLNNLMNKVFVDIACGTARWMVYAAQLGARVFGIDLVSEMLAAASRKPGMAGRLIQADARFLPIADSCAEIVICSFALGYMKEPECLYREMGRVAVRKGLIIASDLHPEALEAGWRRTFRCGLELFEIETYRHRCERLIRAGQGANLQLREVLEPRFDAPEISIMQNAGKTGREIETLNIPAILIQFWERV